MDSFDVAQDIGFGVSGSAAQTVRSDAAATEFAPRRTSHSGLTLQWRGDVPVVVEPPAGQLALKRALDITLSVLLLIALAPLFAIIAVVIRVSSHGPVFFRQIREGRGGKLFAIYKFRTMRADAGDATGVAQTIKNDPRVTAIGNLLRRTSIDELPQLINVLVGHMSLVGPRPHVPGMLAGGRPYRDLVPYYEQRLAVLPGLTGWAQANGWRGPTVNIAHAAARIDHDIAYVQNFSVMLDLKILLMTLRSEFLGGSGH